jgi:hypothetical protein
LETQVHRLESVQKDHQMESMQKDHDHYVHLSNKQLRAEERRRVEIADVKTEKDNIIQTLRSTMANRREEEVAKEIQANRYIERLRGEANLAEKDQLHVKELAAEKIKSELAEKDRRHAKEMFAEKIKSELAEKDQRHVKEMAAEKIAILNKNLGWNSHLLRTRPTSNGQLLRKWLNWNEERVREWSPRNEKRVREL